MKSVAKAISILLHPMIVLFPIPFILVARFSQDYSHALKWTIFSYSFILTVALFVIVGVVFGFFSNFNVSRREQRPLLFSISAFAVFCYLLSLLVLDGPKILFIAVFAIIFGLVVFAIANKLGIKASVHVGTATAVLLLLGITYGGYFFLLLALIPLLAWSRVKMKQHTPSEVIIGSILGIVITLIMYLVSKYYLLGMFYK
jgi:putative transposase